MKPKKGVVLLSGGMDSVTTLYLAKSKGYKLSAIIFDYSQRHKKEIECAKEIALLNGVEYYVEKISLSWARSSLIDKNVRVPSNRSLNEKSVPVTYVSGRNIIFLSYAFSLAESINAKSVFIGAHIQDYSGYPDCRPEFLKKFETAVRCGLVSKKIKISAPLLRKSKKDIIKLGLRLGVPFEMTWSCYNGLRRPCGKCDSCRFRIKAFNDLCVKDPTSK
ncbi:MAG: 7-cyano-7-deazaguanine synthase QueC [Candidatus Omnitrophica bacterium]|nr:7-cyano-7-deazaguanine synthase QueC [Candidatus Omnitrophota bacterium]